MGWIIFGGPSAKYVYIYIYILVYVNCMFLTIDKATVNNLFHDFRSND